MNKITEACKYLLNNFEGSNNVKDYLNNRLLCESITKFNFGYFPELKNISVLTGIISEDDLRDNKLFYNRIIEDSLCPRTIKTSFFEGYEMVLPYKNAYGKVIGLVGRSLLSDDERREIGLAKYKNTPFSKGKHLFGLYENKENILRDDCVYIVEGQFDVIKASEKGFNNIVALGCSNMSSYQFALINRYTDNIFLLLDNDEAGVNGRKGIISKFGDLANIQNFYLPQEYKDVDDYFVRSGNNEMQFELNNRDGRFDDVAEMMVG